MRIYAGQHRGASLFVLVRDVSPPSTSPPSTSAYASFVLVRAVRDFVDNVHEVVLGEKYV